MNHPAKKPHILFLFSDTGGGHRSASEAIIEALQLEFGDQYTTQMVDIFKDYAPSPLKMLPAIYPRIVKAPRVWELGYHLSDGPMRASALSAGAWPYVRGSFRRLIAEHPSDLIVSVHSLANEPVLRALGAERPPFVTVVTDLVTTHATWYHRQADLCLVPTEAARRRALKLDLKPEQVKVVGLPVAERFCNPAMDSRAVRANLGWPQDLPVVVLVGGGDGMGPLRETALAISKAKLSLALVIITGRNKTLQSRLEATDFSMPTFVYGFVREMPDFMAAADVLVTKAGPGTISEALNAGLPMILYSHLPGQESGNIPYVVTEGAGVWAPRTEEIVRTLKNWLEHPDQHAAAVAACKRMARPDAARKIARVLVKTLEQFRDRAYNFN
ncbi:MAG: glycosyltransferase [Chloroflexi bacterium]|jgi:1,2-diacylglycerol 3-beta-galactosyltransferase|nr:glycosyltransferase [Chloroflexota bacterium]